jgi:hypothetical protein
VRGIFLCQVRVARVEGSQLSEPGISVAILQKEGGGGGPTSTDDFTSKVRLMNLL